MRPNPDIDNVPAVGTNVITHEGEAWTLVYNGNTIRLKDVKGLHDLRQLLLNPGRPIHAQQLLGTGTAGHGADPVLDDRAKAEYRARLIELDRELDHADHDCDLGRAELARRERDTLIDELTRAVGLGGRDRRLGDDAERARTTVWARIHFVIDRIGQHHRSLGRHLSTCVSTGVYCCYEPSGSVRWS